jgi:ADP-ribose pyrophosphatase YjhB (NUDIX family)
LRWNAKAPRLYNSTPQRHSERMNAPSKPGPNVHTIPDGDDRPRLTCMDCGYIAYENPKVIVGAVCVWEDKFLMCRRAIEPRKGFWTFPAGFMELNETMAEGAAREVWEEATAKVSITGLLGIFEIPRISQVYVIHSAEMETPAFAAGPESEDVALMAWDEIPWNELAFPSVHWGLERFREGGTPSVHHHTTR